MDTETWLEFDDSGSEDGFDTREVGPIQAHPEEDTHCLVIPWIGGNLLMITPGVSVLNWYLYTGQGKTGFTYGRDGP